MAAHDGGQVRSGQQQPGMKHSCLIMLHTKLGQTELALRPLFKTLMVLLFEQNHPMLREERPSHVMTVADTQRQNKKCFFS